MSNNRLEAAITGWPSGVRYSPRRGPWGPEVEAIRRAVLGCRAEDIKQVLSLYLKSLKGGNMAPLLVVLEAMDMTQSVDELRTWLNLSRNTVQWEIVDAAVANVSLTLEAWVALAHVVSVRLFYATMQGGKGQSVVADQLEIARVVAGHKIADWKHFIKRVPDLNAFSFLPFLQMVTAQPLDCAEVRDRLCANAPLRDVVGLVPLMAQRRLVQDAEQLLASTIERQTALCRGLAEYNRRRGVYNDEQRLVEFLCGPVGTYVSNKMLAPVIAMLGEGGRSELRELLMKLISSRGPSR